MSPQRNHARWLLALAGTLLLVAPAGAQTLPNVSGLLGAAPSTEVRVANGTASAAADGPVRLDAAVSANAATGWISHLVAAVGQAMAVQASLRAEPAVASSATSAPGLAAPAVGGVLAVADGVLQAATAAPDVRAGVRVAAPGIDAELAAGTAALPDQIAAALALLRALF